MKEEEIRVRRVLEREIIYCEYFLKIVEEGVLEL